MLDCLDEYEQYLLNIKKASANTVSSYMRDIRQFRDYVAELFEASPAGLARSGKGKNQEDEDDDDDDSL